ncbi:MAG: ABC transporter ATP-binding protein [Clostridia bacterium]|nr:ABC transporter ATP-binding protein [Clostridia bacterium]MBQ9943794.1 ABC transporter ATP-binding protein [Clostridia bacterium]
MQFFRLLKYAGKYKKYLILCPLVMIGEVVMEMLLPMLTATLIDEVIPQSAETGNLSRVLLYGGLMLLMSVISMGFGMAGSRFSALGGMGFSRNLRQAIFEKVQKYSFKNIDKFSTASLVTRLTTDVNQTQMVVMMLVRMAVRSPIMMVMAVVMAYRMNPTMMPILLVAAPILLVCIIVIMSKAFPRFQIMMKKYDALNASVQENLIGIRVVKAFVRAAHEKEKFEASADDVTATQRAAEKIVIWNGPIMSILMNACVIAALWLGGNQIIGGHMQMGALSSFITYMMQILMSLMMLSFLFVSFVMARASITRICEVLDEEVDIKNPENAVTEVKDGSIVFENVGFSYAGDKENLVLENVNLTIHSGETIGIIGGTGSAKSTLVSLIPRLYDVTLGKVLVGGRDVREYDMHALRDQVAMVLQKNVLFSGSIKDNLRWGNENATDEEIVAACQASAADDFIRSFPEQYDMDLGQGGVNVSGGQKQRLCIARALLKKPKIIIFDDATSAVDTATDARIREALRSHMPQTTKLIIAQRITSVMDADRIMVLDDGKIMDFGTHDELMNRCEIYKEVYTSQQKGVA